MLKQLQFKLMLLLAVLFTGAGTAWADDVTFAYGDYKGKGTSSSGSEYTMVKDDLSIKNTKFYGNNSQAHFYAGGITTITPEDGITITQVDITATAANYNGYQSSGKVTPSIGEMSKSSDGLTVTWKGSATEAFTISNDKQIRWTSIVVTYTSSGGSSLTNSDFALTGAPVALTFDLYNNSNVQVINYTTSSTGAVTVSASDYIETSVDETAKTITVTPKKKTSEAQTITVSQAADDTYKAGSATFTVTIDDSTPFFGAIFDATTDKGTSPIVKENVSFACSNGVLDNGTEYRLYKNSTTTISTTDGSKITKIEFTNASSNPATGFGSQTGWTTSNTGGVWEGEAESVSFEASGAQVRATVIKVTVSATTNPFITAENVNIVYDATSGSISYTINNPANGTLTASVPQGSWLTLGTVGETVPFTCEANSVASEREAIVTLTYTYDTDKTVTKTVTVIQAGNPNAPGTENNPYTVAQALAAIDANEGITDVYVTGIVSRNTYFSESNGTITYFISDDGTENNELEAYSGKGINGAKFTSQDDIQVGDVVVIRGNLTLYNNTTYEFSSGNQLVSLDRKEVKYYLAGSWGENDYGWGEGMEQLTKSGNTYTISKNLANGTQFKIVKVDETVTPATTTWYGGSADGEWFGVNSNVCENLTLSDTGKNFQIDGDCDDSFTFTVNAENPDALTLTVTGWHVPVVKYYLAGNWSENWGEGKVELTANADGTYSCSKLVGNGSRFKFVKTVDDAEIWYGANQTGDDYGIHSAWCTDVELSDNASASAFVIQMASDRELAFTLNADDMKFSVTGWPISIEGNLFVKVTTADDFTDGAYLIVNETAGVAFDGSLETFDAENNVIKVKIVNNTIVANSITKESLFTIVNNGKITSASGHYIGVSSYSNSLKLDESATSYINSVTFDESGNADISINITGSTNYMYLKYNKASNQNRFRYYKSGQEDIQLYKLVTATEIPVAVSAAGYATYCSENNLDFSGTGVTAYKATVTDKQVSFTEVEQVPAGEGVLLKGAEGTYTIPVIASATAIENDFIGVTTAKEVEAGIFVLMNGNDGVGFYKTQNAFTVGANTAYLPAIATARTFIGLDDSTTTGINAIENGKLTIDNVVYNLNGQRVAAPKKGLYIINGKKVVLK